MNLGNGDKFRNRIKAVQKLNGFYKVKLIYVIHLVNFQNTFLSVSFVLLNIGSFLGES